MCPLGVLLLTRMNPLAVKIWIGGCCAPHTSTSGEPSLMVPKLVLPDPANRRSTGPLANGGAAALELGAVDPGALALVAFAGDDSGRAVYVVFEALVEPVGAPTVDAVVDVIVCVVPVEDPPPQPASARVASSATLTTAPGPCKRLRECKPIDSNKRRAYWIHRLVASTRPGRSSTRNSAGSATIMPTTAPAISAVPGTAAWPGSTSLLSTSSVETAAKEAKNAQCAYARDSKRLTSIVTSATQPKPTNRLSRLVPEVHCPIAITTADSTTVVPTKRASEPRKMPIAEPRRLRSFARSMPTPCSPRGTAS